MPETEWPLVVYRLPPNTARLHTAVERGVELLKPLDMQRCTVRVADTADARSALVDLKRNVSREGRSLIVLRSAFLAGDTQGGEPSELVGGNRRSHRRRGEGTVAPRRSAA